MKTAIAVSIAALGLCMLFSQPANAQNYGNTRVSSSTDASSLALPVGATLAEYKRFFKPKGTKRFSHIVLPSNWQDLGWRTEITLGFVSTTAFAGANPLYACFIAGKEDFFTSNNPECDGQQKMAQEYHFIGYIAGSQIEGTIPLYRCTLARKNSHYDTLGSNCEGTSGATLDGILGYIFL
jgi:hypothetical protein